MKRFIYILLLWSVCLYGGHSPSSFEGMVLTTDQHTYELQNYLSRGAFGAVFQAINENGEEVAIKVFLNMNFGLNSNFFTKSWPFPREDQPKPETESGAVQQQPSPVTNHYRIEREWEVGTQFDHPNIIKAFDRGVIPSENEEDGSFLVLELVSGMTIGQLSPNQLSKEELIVVSLQLLDALKYGVSNHMFYTDLHVENVMLSNDHALKLVDLGSFQSGNSTSKIPRKWLYWYLQSTYFFIKTVLKQGGYPRDELLVLLKRLKDEVKLVQESELPHLELYIHVLDAWSSVLSSIKDELDGVMLE